MSDADGIAAAALVSGGIDSAVLVAELSKQYRRLFPVFVRSGLFWESAELAHLELFLGSIAQPRLSPLTILEQPVSDVYGNHWSVTGRDVPHAATPDDAVFLPGRNLFLITKTAAWCVQNNVPVLALGSLAANPFADSTPEFDQTLEQLAKLALGTSPSIIRPFATLMKSDVIRRGAALPLEFTMSCLRPVHGEHCGECNKCAERRAGFERAGVSDRTRYAR